LINCFENDFGAFGYPNVSISADNIMVKLNANAEQNATPVGLPFSSDEAMHFPSRGKHLQNQGR
jgi:hypothetical protein